MGKSGIRWRWMTAIVLGCISIGMAGCKSPMETEKSNKRARHRKLAVRRMTGKKRMTAMPGNRSGILHRKRPADPSRLLTRNTSFLKAIRGC